MDTTNSKLKIILAVNRESDLKVLYDALSDEYEIISAGNGADAIRALEDNRKLSAVILEPYLPDHDGFAVLEKMLAFNEFNKIPVLVITEPDDRDSQMRAYDLGAAGTLLRPLDGEIVLHKLRNTIIRSAGSTIDERNELFLQIYRRTELDPKTGIYNRATFCREARKLLNEHPNDPYVIVRWDIDGLKVLNDTYGTETGDRFLRLVGEMYIRNASSDFVYGRWEADHFVICMPYDIVKTNEFVRSLTEFEGFSSMPIKPVFRVGIYVIDDKSIDISLMCDRALLALRSIKGNYSKHVAMYSDSMREEMLESQQLVDEMESALADDQFVVYLQPQYNYSSGRLHGAEALVRWDHPSKGLLLPGKFLPAFEKNGFITKLDMYIWEQVCKLQRRLLDEGHTIIPISVNVSRTDIYNLDLGDFFTRLLNKYDLKTDAIRVEITESAYADNPQQLIDAVDKLRLAGFAVEMDDFGSGYSSLNSLKDVPVDLLKLDMKFVSGAISEKRGGSILSSVIRMSNWLSLPVLAEGVETKEQADYLKSIGCIYMQGYYFAKPLPIDEFEKLLTKDAHEENILEGSATYSENYAEFLDITYQSTLLFNSFVGGAAIGEFDGEKLEVLRINDKFFDIVGLSRERFVEHGKDLLSSMKLSNREIAVNAIKHAVETGDEAECKMLFSPVNMDTELWIHARTRALSRTENSYIIYFTVEDITEQMNLSIGNSKLDMLLKAVYDAVPCGLMQFIKSKDGFEMQNYNSLAWQILGFSSEEEFRTAVKEKMYNGALHPDDRVRVAKYIAGISSECHNNDEKILHRIFSPTGEVRTICNNIRRVVVNRDLEFIQYIFTRSEHELA